MPNRNYLRGRAREYAIKKALESQGLICLRTAGSHGFADLIALDTSMNVINFIQVKPKAMSIRAKTALQSKISWVERVWQGRVHVVSLVKEIKLENLKGGNE